jgi:hypothetical protein
VANIDFRPPAENPGMTNSNQDGEALAAIRAANKILNEAKTSWAQIVQPGAQASPFAASHRGGRSTATANRHCLG